MMDFGKVLLVNNWVKSRVIVTHKSGCLKCPHNIVQPRKKTRGFTRVSSFRYHRLEEESRGCGSEAHPNNTAAERDLATLVCLFFQVPFSI